MALHAAPTPIGRPRAIAGSRGVPTRVVLEVNDALAPCLEGVAFAQEAEAIANRIGMAAAAGSRHAVNNEAGRLAFLATRYAIAFRLMAADIEGPEAA